MDRKLFFKINLFSIPLTYLIMRLLESPIFSMIGHAAGLIHITKGFPFVFYKHSNISGSLETTFSWVALTADVLVWYIISTLIIYGLYLIKTKLFSRSKTT